MIQFFRMKTFDSSEYAFRKSQDNSFAKVKFSKLQIRGNIVQINSVILKCVVIVESFFSMQ